jgi:heat shock protein HslJ
MAVMKIFSPVLLAFPLLASCQTMTDTPPIPNAAAKYVARGNEPGWIVTMDATSIDYEGDYGETRINMPAPQGRPSFNGMRYVTDRLTVDINYSSCTDDMSGKRFADTVSVVADGKELRGCGGRVLPPESLNDTTWSIITIGQLPVLEGVNTEVRFADGRISGSAGCNRFNGSYNVAGNVLTFGSIASTRMMCPDKQMKQESSFLSLLNGPLTKRYTVEGYLILSDDKGNRATLRQVL